MAAASGRTDGFDLAAYLARIGLDGRPSVAEVHRAHVTAIPFENLDPYCGVPVSLALGEIQRKLVSRRRGGYCFEQNLLLKAACEALGTEVEVFLARVRFGAAPGELRPRTHLVLRVRDGDATWHADAGFGAGSILDPLPFGVGDVHEQSGWRFRVVRDGPELVLQTADGAGWLDLYGFEPTPVPFVDLETSNWFTSTHPRSRFVLGPIVSSSSADGSRAMLRNWDGLALKEQTPEGSTLTPVALAEVPALIDERFGLPGFTTRSDGRLTPPPS